MKYPVCFVFLVDGKNAIEVVLFWTERCRPAVFLKMCACNAVVRQHRLMGMRCPVSSGAAQNDVILLPDPHGSEL